MCSILEPHTRLSADGIAAVDVPAKLGPRVRVLSTGHGRKNDDADAISVAVAAHDRAPGYAPSPLTRRSPRCVPWSNTATTWSRPAPRR